ncbi:MAG TPA: Na+/H+ antiporter NhaA [Phycisphaerales bacterium]|nr:Na+/H+ antiporter NhaA [Phycisphaerales bacterium]
MAHGGHDYFEDVAKSRRAIDTAVAPFVAFSKKEAAGGIVLLASTVVALILANSSAAHAYHEFWTETFLKISFRDWVFPAGKHPGHLEWWVNDALMAAFFFVIGLEIKREVIAGELRNPRKAALPLIAAAGGMLIPGLIYAAFNWGADSLRGWAIPTATDIAFALGVLALLGKRIPPGLRIFLATLAIADDLGALLIIAFFYTRPEDLSMPFLGLAFAATGLMAAMNFLGIRKWWVYGFVGVLLWFCVLQSGVHATIAGVMGAMTIPARSWVRGDEFTRHIRRLADEFQVDYATGGRTLTSGVQQSVLLTMEKLTEAAQTPLQRLEKGMLPLAAFVVVPIFALANAGVTIGDVADHAIRDSEAWGIVAGLAVGKALGIAGFSWLAVKLGVCVLPTAVTWRHMIGVAILGGIGFTMSLFIAHLAFGASERLEIAKLAVLTGSTLAAILGTIVLLTCPSPGRESSAAAH